MNKNMRYLTIGIYIMVFFATTASYLYAYGYPPFSRVVTLTELCSSPELWTGIRVRVKGEIMGLLFIPEQVPPYRYGLRDPTTHSSIGLTWPNGDMSRVPFDRIVTVVGTVVDGQTSGLWKPKYVHFLKAESIEG